VQNRIVVVAAAVLAVAGLAACTPKPHDVVAGSAVVTVNGDDAHMNNVNCSQRDWFQTINIGGAFAKATIVVDQRALPVTALSVRIQNLGGFTGMYSKGDGGEADMSLSGDRYTVTGVANGSKADKTNEPMSAKFKIIATC
jgi:hypothetical protein